MKVSARMLRLKEACTEQVDKFQELFGDATIEITKVLCVKHASDFDWSWAAAHLLPAPLLAEYKAKAEPLWAEYNAKVAALWAEYNAKVAPLWAEYEDKRAPLWAEYDAKVAPLWAAYDSKVEPISAEYEAKIAQLFGQLAERC